MPADINRFKSVTGFEPNLMQAQIFDQIGDEQHNPALLLKAPTGSGKTEAVLIPSLLSGRRLFLIFPTRSLVDDQIMRCRDYLIELSKIQQRSYALVVDRGGFAERTVYRDGESIGNPGEKPHRHLYDGDVIITTLDKFLYRFFGFGETRKSYTFPFRIHYGIDRNLFCFDEAHSYDGVAFANFVRLIRALYRANLDLVVMTATMPITYQKEELPFLKVIDFTQPNQVAKLNRQLQRTSTDRQFQFINVESKSISDQMEVCLSGRYAPNRRIIVTIETVAKLIEFFEWVNGRFDNLLLYHGRLSDQQRRKVYQALKSAEAHGNGYVLLTTSAIEVGCDLDAHCLITEICNPDQLIQRVGRCNRRGKMAEAEVVVVGQKIQPFLRTITETDEEAYIQRLQQQNGSHFQANPFLELMTHQPRHDYRAEVLFDMLYEYAYETKLENKPLHDRGLVITRGFEPSVTLTTKAPTQANSGNQPKSQPQNAVSVSIRQCTTNNPDRITSEVKVYNRSYNDYEEKFEIKELSQGGSLYFKDLFVEVPADFYDETTGYVEVPKVFKSSWQEGYKQFINYKTGDNKTIWLNYLLDLDLEPVEPTTSESEEADVEE